MSNTPIIIGGCPRSGTTLLRAMLDSHPNIYSGVEIAITMQAAEATIDTWEAIGKRLQLYEIEDGDVARAYGKAIEHILERARQKSGKPRIADKMPQSIQHFNTLSWMLPESKFVHLIRDGRDVACSIVNHTVEFKDKNGNPMWFTKDEVEAVKYWKWITNRGLLMRNHPNGDRYYEIFYEDLVKYPETEMRKLLDFLNEPWDNRVLKHFEDKHELEETTKQSGGEPNTNSIGRWKMQLTEEQQKRIQELIGSMLNYLNYT